MFPRIVSGAASARGSLSIVSICGSPPTERMHVPMQGQCAVLCHCSGSGWCHLPARVARLEADGFDVRDARIAEEECQSAF